MSQLRLNIKKFLFKKHLLRIIIINENNLLIRRPFTTWPKNLWRKIFDGAACRMKKQCPLLLKSRRLTRRGGVEVESEFFHLFFQSHHLPLSLILFHSHHLIPLLTTRPIFSSTEAPSINATGHECFSISPRQRKPNANTNCDKAKSKGKPWNNWT